MKIVYKISIISVLAIATITSCSRKKNSFINRNFHAVTGEYNALFNGSNALEQGRENLNNGYNDNYWELLPIERMQVNEEIVLPGQSKNQDFTKAEEKAVKAIQKHGMNIQGKEYNPQMDEAYLLLGQARYFDQRFVPALEAFNYILYKYPASDKINTAKVWREKTNIRLENDELAIKNLKRLLEQEELDDQELADATSILAQAYINTKSLDSALVQMKIAAEVTKKNDEKGRFQFIKGQLYNALTYKDSANSAFDEVLNLNRKIPRRYLMAAHVEKAKNFDYSSGDKVAFLKQLTKLEKDRENRPYLDKIYHQIAEFHLTNQFDSLAVSYYNKSLREDSKDKILVAKNYETLGDFYFDRNSYKTAGAYFDSTMTSMVKNSKPYRTIKRKRENLDDVIYYEGVAETNDSILKIVKMPEAQRLAFFKEHTNLLKEKLKKEQERLEIEERKKGLATTNTPIDNVNKPRGGLPGASSNFYFYNQSTVSYGKNEFSRIWGDRKNEDNWRWSSARGGVFNNQTGPDAVAINGEDDVLLDPEYYLSQIPSTKKEVDSIKKERNYAYYQLGLIYKEKFKEYELSKSKFLNLLASLPEDKLILPSKYNLYKIYDILGQNQEASTTKKDIISNYASSRYAEILKNPELAAIRDESSPESLYEATYKLLENQDYGQVITKSKKYMTFFDGDAIVPKFALLKATANGRLNGYQAYVDGLNDVALAYANTEEATQAQAIVNSLKSVSKKEFKLDTEGTSFKTVYQFKTSQTEAIANFKKTLDDVNQKNNYKTLNTSIDIFNPEITFVVIHGLRSIEGAKGYVDMIRTEDKYKVSKPNFGISTENYSILQIHKNLKQYLEKS
ncbi:hypothetical protein [Olleya sp. R77988]|uniref:type IX secretion system periplasmic lipoprotein PorW/SprE n=1 Tax=Olleya sp. R77988 TaxID=3093875 RepID=UPI0037CB328B